MPHGPWGPDPHRPAGVATLLPANCCTCSHATPATLATRHPAQQLLTNGLSACLPARPWPLPGSSQALLDALRTYITTGTAWARSHPVHGVLQHLHHAGLLAARLRHNVVLPGDERRRRHHDALKAAAVQPKLDAPASRVHTGHACMTVVWVAVHAMAQHATGGRRQRRFGS